MFLNFVLTGVSLYIYPFTDQHFVIFKIYLAVYVLITFHIDCIVCILILFFHGMLIVVGISFLTI